MNATLTPLFIKHFEQLFTYISTHFNVFFVHFLINNFQLILLQSFQSLFEYLILLLLDTIFLVQIFLWNCLMIVLCLRVLYKLATHNDSESDRLKQKKNSINCDLENKRNKGIYKIVIYLLSYSYFAMVYSMGKRYLHTCMKDTNHKTVSLEDNEPCCSCVFISYVYIWVKVH